MSGVVRIERSERKSRHIGHRHGVGNKVFHDFGIITAGVGGAVGVFAAVGDSIDWLGDGIIP